MIVLEKVYCVNEYKSNIYIFNTCVKKLNFYLKHNVTRTVGLLLLLLQLLVEVVVVVLV